MFIGYSYPKNKKSNPPQPFFAYKVVSDYYLGREGDTPFFRIHTSSSKDNESAGEGCYDCSIDKITVGKNRVDVYTDKGSKNPVALVVNTEKSYDNIYNFIIQQLDPKTYEVIEFSDGEKESFLKDIEKW
ncbi:hypothetical protein KBC75_01825 [Candidatus Shapirobacteria bacterium]|nr:hypothetical protein [Candidatus Shapirobacteria bacterium]